MSALPPKADMLSVEINVCFVPLADIHGKPITDALQSCLNPASLGEKHPLR
jgi:hypothetical protein